MGSEDVLIGAMSNEDIAELKTKHANEPSVITLLDGILETREKEAVQVKAKIDFEKGITKLLDKLPHPDGVHNIYVLWAEVDIPDGEPEVLAEDVCLTNGLELGTTRQASHKEYQWVAKVNYAVKATSGNGGGKGSNEGARTTIIKEEVNDRLVVVGEYASSRTACDALKLGKPNWVTDDSGTRELKKNGYLPYDKVTGNLKG